MPGRNKKRGSKGRRKSTAENADLQAPLHLSTLNTSTSTSSITRSPSDLTPPIAAPDFIALGQSNAQTAAMDAFEAFEKSPKYGQPNQADTPPAPPAAANLHSKLENETPRYSKTNAFNSFQRAVSSAKMLHQVLGMQAPEPYQRPPEMPQDVERRFFASLQEYGLDFDMQGMNLGERVGQAAGVQKNMTVGIALGKAVLEDIREEKESPVKTAFKEMGTGGKPVGMTIDPPAWTSEFQAVAGTSHVSAIEQGKSNQAGNIDLLGDYAPAHPPFGSSPARVNDTASGTNFENSCLPYYQYPAFDSTTTLADSRPGSSAAPNTSAAYPAEGSTSLSAQSASFVPAITVDDDGTDAGYMHSHRSNALIDLAEASPVPAGQDRQLFSYESQAINSNYIPQRVEYARSALFPSPRVEQDQAWDFVQQPDRSIAPHGFAPGGFAPAAGRDTQVSGSLPFLTAPRDAAPVPRIVVKSPSPKKPTSKKRGHGSQHKIGPIQSKTKAADETLGLPVLEANQEAKWKFKFPGNTYALLTLMLAWSIKMQSLYKKLPNSYLFSVNAAFPYPIDPPVFRRLVSVAFYDTSVTPHKEIRFISPGDVGEISYNEVDVFSYPAPETELEKAQAAQDGAIRLMKRALMLNSGPTTKELKDSQRAANGEGRWAYILLQGHKSQLPNETPPHAIIAWQLSAMTSKSECLHTIYPDNHVAPKPAAPAPTHGPKRFSSLQNLAAKYSESHRLSESLRSASSSELPMAEVPVPVPDGALTFKRKVWKMEKAGRIPLVEGYRVDVQKWSGWLDAVGRGQGKVIVWEER
jgi:hypothetical protein